MNKINILIENHKEPLCEMANILKSKELNLPVNIWVSSETKNKHIPRIKVQQDFGNRVHYDNFCSLSIDDSPKILAGDWCLSQKTLNNTIKDFILINKDVLLDIWKNENNINQALGKLKGTK